MPAAASAAVGRLWQAAACFWRPFDIHSLATGTSSQQTGNRQRQRGAKGQPSSGRNWFGGTPSIGINVLFFSPSIRGDAQMAARALGEITTLSAGERKLAGALCARPDGFSSRTWDFWRYQLELAGNDTPQA